MTVGVPILMYHQISPRPHAGFERWTITPAVFARQLGWLARAGYSAVDLDTLMDARAGRGTLPTRAVVITIDDALRDCVEHAVPALRAHGFAATFFVVAGLVGGRSAWLRREVGAEYAMADWQAIESLAAAGFRCGAHTMSHPRLPELADAACRDELARSRATLEARIGSVVRHLAYPFGAYDARVRALAAEAGFATACSVREGLSGPGDDPLALHRVHVVGGESLATFATRVRIGWSVLGLARDLVARARLRAGALRAGVARP